MKNFPPEFGISKLGKLIGPLLSRSSTLIGLAIAALFLFNFFRFGEVCRQFGDHAQKGAAQLNDVAVISDEAIVVLTGDRHRIPKALELLRVRQDRLLIISGTARGISLTELVNQQGDATINIHEIWKKIILEPNSQSTVENAEESAKILIKNKIRRVILVTSEYHMLRSSTIFHRVLPKLEIVDYPVTSDFTSANHQFSQRTLNGAWNFWVEYWKLLLYKIYFSHLITSAPGRGLSP